MRAREREGRVPPAPRYPIGVGSLRRLRELDLVARINFESEKEMSKTLIEDMRHVEGVRKTETLIAVEV